MYKILFKLMKKNNFSNITEYLYDENGFSIEEKIPFLELYEKLKELIKFHNINKNNKILLREFWKEIIKINYEEKVEIINNNPCITYFLNKKDFSRYIDDNKSESERNWFLFNATFNKEFINLNLKFFNKNLSLQQAGRYMLLNKNVNIEEIKNLLNNLTIQDFASLNGIYLSWDEFIKLILKAEFDPKKFLEKLARKTSWMGVQAIISGFFSATSKIAKEIKLDKDFISRIEAIKNQFIAKKSKNIEFKFLIKDNEVEMFFKNIKNIFELFTLPTELKEKSFMSQIITNKSFDVNYDTTQINIDYLDSFLFQAKYDFYFYKKYLNWVKNNNKIISTTWSNKTKSLNNLWYEWIFQKDIEISGFIALKILKNIIELIFINKKMFFKKMSFYEILQCVSQKINKNNIKWSSEILFAPLYNLLNVRNKIAHFDDVNEISNFLIMCLAKEILQYGSENNIV